MKLRHSKVRKRHPITGGPVFSCFDKFFLNHSDYSQAVKYWENQGYKHVITKTWRDDPWAGIVAFYKEN